MNSPTLQKHLQEIRQHQLTSSEAHALIGVGAVLAVSAIFGFLAWNFV